MRSADIPLILSRGRPDGPVAHRNRSCLVCIASRAVHDSKPHVIEAEGGETDPERKAAHLALGHHVGRGSIAIVTKLEDVASFY